MKRIISVLCIAALLLGLFACTGSPENQGESSTAPSTTEAPSTEPPTTEPPTTEPPEPYRVRGSSARVYRTASGTVWALAFATVENTGSENLFLDYGTMILRDENGREVGRIGSVAAYPQILPPGAIAYYCDVIALDIEKVQDLKVEFEAPITTTQKEAQRYSFSDLELTDSSFGGMILQGQVTNTTEQTGELVCISAILYDQDKAPAGFICGYLDQPLAPGESAEFSFESYMLPTYLLWENVTDYWVYGYSLEESP